MTTTVSPPKETTTTTVTVPQTTGTSTPPTSRLRSVLRSVLRRLRPVPGSLTPQDHLDPVHWTYGTVHPMHLR